jgi:aspartate dehydrogenase
MESERIDCPILALPSLPDHADLAVEAAPAAILEDICRPMLSAGKTVMVLSAGALLPRPDLIDLARQAGGQIIVPTGALLGLDAVTAAAEGEIHSVRMTTRKPPRGLAGAPYLEKNGISVEGLEEPKRVFSGTAREAAAGFPANVNVAAALSLAGIGPDRTMIEIWADPGVSRNCHTIEVDADSARFTLSIENVPSENPKTGRITALSALAALRKLHAPLRIGT